MLTSDGWHRWAFVTVLVVSTGLRCTQLDAPLLDGMAVKQIFIAHKARAIAGPPFNLLNNSFDFLQDDGQRMQLTEEVPLYTGLLAAGYSVFGEREWLGRLLSSLAMLIATAALYDLFRCELGRELALLATVFFACSPLMLMYGQTVQPDACMLACMLVAACCYTRHLQGGRWRWWLAATVCGALAGLFKYYGLMVMLPLAFLHLRQAGWRGLFAPRLVLLGLVMTAPLALWMGTVFLHSPNPARHSEYFLFQMPELLWQETLYLRFLDRFLWKDCGPLMCGFVGTGAVAGLFTRFGKGSARPLWGWTALALGFYFLMGPLLRCHDYYEMMMMPAAAGWAALGWDALCRTLIRSAQPTRRRLWALSGAALTVAIVHSPWVTSAKFESDPGFDLAAQSVARHSTPGRRIVVVAPDNAVAVVHYARREGWTTRDAHGLRERLLRHRDDGAEFAIIYVNHDFQPAQREKLREVAATLPVLEHDAGFWAGRSVPGAYFLVRLADLPEAPASAQR